MQQTTNQKFNLPDYTDVIDIDKINENFRTLDSNGIFKTGGTMTGALNVITPTADAHASTKKYVDDLFSNVIADGPGAHNAIYRGKSLGDTVTAAQYAAIAAGTFEDLFIGDYWTIANVVYRIAAFDYYINTGDTACTTHHVTLVPDKPLYTAAMNSSNVTTGAYMGSAMYTSGLNTAKNTINAAFGSAHILNHRQLLTNATTSGYASAGSWVDSTVELMNEQNVYGNVVFNNVCNGSAVPYSYTIDKTQYPLFTFRPDLIGVRETYWLRDVVSSALFARVGSDGYCDYGVASSVYGVRPAFSIKS